MFLIVFIVGASALRLCNVGIPCQDINVGVIRGAFNLSASPTPRIFLTAVIDSRNAALMPHFIDHYSSLGVLPANMLLLLNGPNASASLDATHRTLTDRRTNVIDWIGPFSSTAKLYHQVTLLASVAAPDWLVYADLDEFIVFPERLDAFAARLAREKITAVRGKFVDRVSANGSLASIAPSPTMAEQFPLICPLTKNLLRGADYKIVLVRADYRASSGHHDVLNQQWYASNNLSSSIASASKPQFYKTALPINHYKWTAGIVASLRERMQYLKNVVHAVSWTESDRFIRSVQTTGRIDIDALCTRKPTNSSVAKKPTSATSLSQLWVNNATAAVAPLCRLAGQSNMCARTNTKTISGGSCPIGLIGGQSFDRMLADEIAKFARGSTVLELNAQSGCYSFYWAASLAFKNFTAIDTDQRFSNRTRNLVQHRPAETGLNVSADYLVMLNSTCTRSDDRRCYPIIQLARSAYRGIVFSLHSANSSADELLRAYDDLGFSRDDRSTAALRRVTKEPTVKSTLVVLYRRELVAYRYDTSFLHKTIAHIDWNNGLSFAGRWYRVFLPPTLRWTDYRVVIGVLSMAKSTAMRQTIRETWGARARVYGCLVIFLIADPPSSAEQQEASRHADMVLLEAREVYTAMNSSLPLKSHSLMQLFARYATDAAWLLKCDDDTLVYPDRLLAFLNSMANPRNTSYYAGCVYAKSPPIRNEKHNRAYVSPALYPASLYPNFMSGGAGYVLSSALVRCLTLHTAGVNYRYFPREDVSVSLAIHAACRDVQMVDKSQQFKPGTPKTKTDNIITQHYVKGARGIADLWHPADQPRNIVQ